MIQNKSQSENEPGVNLQAYALADDTENCLPQDTIISPSFRPLPCVPAPCYRTVLVQLVIITSGQLCPLANPISPPQIEAPFYLCDRLFVEAQHLFPVLSGNRK